MGIDMIRVEWVKATISYADGRGDITDLYIPRVYDGFNNRISNDGFSYKPDGNIWNGDDIQDEMSCTEFLVTEDRFPWMDQI